jgi:hypothetical protein
LEREVEGEKKGRGGYFFGMGGSKTGEYSVEGEKLFWRVQRTIQAGTVEGTKKGGRWGGVLGQVRCSRCTEYGVVLVVYF